MFLVPNLNVLCVKPKKTIYKKTTFFKFVPMMKVYLDNCVTTKPDQQVIEAMLPYLTDKYYFPANFISSGSAAKRDLDSFKKTIADSLNADEKEIHLTSGGTAANNVAIKGYIMANVDKGNHIICSEIDYPDILTNAAFFENSGFEITYLSADKDGFVDLNELKSTIKKSTICVMTTLVNHVMGTIQPVKKMKEIIKQAGSDAALFVDAVQGYGKMKIDVKDMDVDLLSISAHKIHGPQGAGALYVKKGIHLAQIKHGIVRMDDLDTGGISMANLAGMAKAIDVQFNDLDRHINHMTTLRDRLYNGITQQINDVLVNGTMDDGRICNNLNISIDDIEGEAIMMMLDIAGITVATGSACASQGLKPNYILMATGRTFTQSHGSIKFTLSRMTTKDEIDYTVEKFINIVNKLKRMSPLNR